MNNLSGVPTTTSTYISGFDERKREREIGKALLLVSLSLSNVKRQGYVAAAAASKVMYYSVKSVTQD